MRHHRWIALALLLGLGLLLSLVVWSLVNSDPSMNTSERTREASQNSSTEAKTLESEEGLTEVAPLEVQRTDEILEEELPEPVDLQAADRDLDLFGRVVDPDGNPFPGALVETVVFPWRRTTVLHLDGYYLSRVTASTRTAADGTFTFRLQHGEVVTLRVRAQSYALAEIPLCVAGERVEVILQHPRELEVLVKDAKNNPVADVRLRVWLREGRSTSHNSEGLTGEDGRHVFPDLPAGRGYLSLEHKTLGSPTWQRVHLEEPGRTRLEVRMPTGRVIRGLVVDALTLQPIEGAKVGSNWVVNRPVLSDADGRYEFPGWTGIGVDDLHVLAEGYGRQGKVVPPEGEVNFELDPGDRATGRILDAQSSPVGGALVTAIGSQRTQSQRIDSRSTQTEIDGSFELTSLRRDLPHTLVVQAQGHGRYLIDFDPHPGGAGLIQLGDVQLPEARKIEGRAEDGNGQPIRGAEVVLSGHNSDRGRLRPHASGYAHDSFYGKRETRKTDDLGRFRFPDLAPGSYELKVSRPGSPTAELTCFLGDEDILDVILKLEGKRTLVVHVVDENGEPLAGIFIQVYGEGNRRLSEETRLDGRAHFSNLSSDEVRVEAFSVSGHLQPDPIRVVPEDQEIQIVLERSAVLEGEVIGPDGSRLPGLEVAANTDDGRRFSAFAEEDGRFQLSTPPQTPLTLSLTGRQRTQHKPGRWKVSHAGYEGQLRDVLAPASGLVLYAQPLNKDRTLEVIVQDHSGVPVESARVEIWMDGTSLSIDPSTTDSSGRLLIANLSELPVRVMVSPPDDLISALPVWSENIPADQNTVLLELGPTAYLEGRVIGPDGAALSGAKITAYSAGLAYRMSRTDSTGEFRMHVQKDARYRVVARKSLGAETLQGEIEGVTTDDGELTIRLQPQSND